MLMQVKSGPTEVVELTPRGRGALAVVLVAGPEAAVAVDARFHAASGRALIELPIGRIAVGHWGSPDGEQLIVCRRAADRVEIHCHGGRAAVAAVVDQLREYGCHATPWQDWTRRTAEDPLRAAARIALADAPTQRTAAILLDQFHGALGTAVVAALEATQANQWPAAKSTIEALLGFGDLGLHLTEPWRVVLAGWPNVGKSSLINALAGHERAIVCDRPGTTRDVVTNTTAIDGWPILLSDTAGLCDSADELEAAGVARAAAAVAEADLVILVRDASEPGDVAAPNDDIAARLSSTARLLCVLNKIDLLAVPPAGTSHDVLTSATTGRGIGELTAAIGRALVPVAPPGGAGVPFTLEQIVALQRARTHVERRDRVAACGVLQSLLAP
jgi:tRNA modification GTPase